MYSMYNCDYKTLTSFESKKSPFIFNTDRGLTSKFKIEELDLLTSRYESETQFYNDLLQYSGKYVDGENKNIIITHKRGDKTYLDDVIYNDRLICISANDLINKKKKNKTNNKKILLSNNEVLLEFIEYIKHLALDDRTSIYLLDPNNLDNSVNSNDKKLLDECLKDDILLENNKVHKGLKSILEDYRYNIMIYNEYQKQGRSTLDVVYDINKLDADINYIIRSDYSILRNLVVWENRFLNVLRKQINSSNDDEKNNYYSELIQEISLQKSYRNGYISKDELNEALENIELEKIYNKENNNNTLNQFTESDISNLYRKGGIDEVMKYTDIDDIYGNNSNLKETESLGIVKENKEK